MSSAGISVHEANLESNRDSFKGFPWLIRLRYIMENAKNIEESKTLWDATKNTVGFNHMVASASDNSALVMETDAKHTAYFSANSEVEANSIAHTSYQDKDLTIRGHPLTEALFRTNHGFDPETIAHYNWNNTHAYYDSDKRYTMLHD
jgi:hypothetical protein